MNLFLEAGRIFQYIFTFSKLMFFIKNIIVFWYHSLFHQDILEVKILYFGENPWKNKELVRVHTHNGYVHARQPTQSISPPAKVTNWWAPQQNLQGIKIGPAFPPMKNKNPLKRVTVVWTLTVQYQYETKCTNKTTRAMQSVTYPLA